MLTSIVDTMLRSIIRCFKISPDGSNADLSTNGPKCSSTGLCRTVLVLELETSVPGVLISEDAVVGSGSEKGSRFSAEEFAIELVAGNMEPVEAYICSGVALGDDPNSAESPS